MGRLLSLLLMKRRIKFFYRQYVKNRHFKKAILKTDTLKYVDYFDIDKRIISQTSI